MDIKIKDGKPNAVIKSIADQLNVDIIYSPKSVGKINLPEKVGKGWLQQINYRGGISVIEVNVFLKEEINLNYIQGHLHPLKILLNKKGRVKHQFHDKNEPEYLKELGSVALASVAEQYHTIFLPKNQQVSLISIRINRKKFEKYIEEFTETMDINIAALLRDVNGINPYFFETYYDYQTSQILEKYFDLEHDTVVENLHLLGLTYQLISIQFNRIKSDNLLSIDEKKKVRSYSEKIIEAANSIKSNITEFTTVIELANKVNLNTKKLQLGFNEMFGMSVLEYVTDYRLKKVKSMLSETDLTISEICYRLGINSPSYMSKIFKEKFGISPKDYRKAK